MVSSLSEIERIISASVHFLLTFQSNLEKVIQLISEKVFAKCRKCDIVENKVFKIRKQSIQNQIVTRIISFPLT